MPNYRNAKIYVLKRTKNGRIFYVGSTIAPLSKRVGQHIGALRNESKQKYPLYSYILKKGGKRAFYIELYKTYPCDSREQLVKMERRVITRLTGKGIKLYNHQVPGRTKSEYAKTDKIKDYQRQYRANHKEKRLKYDPITIQCECGLTYVGLGHKKRHEQSIKHQKRMAEKEEE